jgi:hypothetical protein
VPAFVYTGGDPMSKFKLLLAVSVLLVIVTLLVVTHNVSAGDPNGGVHGIITALL